MKRSFVLIPMLGVIGFLHGCLGGSGSSDDSVLVEGDFAVAYVKRDMSALGNPTDGARYAPGGDLYLKDLSSPSADTNNITGSIVQGPHDVSDPEVSFDGQSLLFAMRAPEWQNNATWNLFEYSLATKTLSRLISDDDVANAGDDVDPAYLPDGRIVFSSNRQKTTQAKMAAGNKVEPYEYRDEYEREATMVLHVLDRSFESDPSNDQYITQISVNQSHDRNPTVLKSGEIMFARWDHVGNRNHFPLFTTNPGGTNMFVLYGAFSAGNSFLHPREMPDGRVMSTLMPLSGTDEGGALMIVDVKNFTDNTQPADETTSGRGQVQARPSFPVPLGRDFSENGRYTTPYPLWDGTNRALVAFKVNPKQEDAQTELNPITGQEEAQENPPRYGIYMLNMDTDQLLPIALPDPDGNFAYTDPIALIPRDENCPIDLVGGCMPALRSDGLLDQDLANRGTGELNVMSVYDTDDVGLMGDRVLTASESIPKIDGIPDLKAMKTPGTPEYLNRVARFVRVTQAVPTPPRVSRELIGESDFEMQQILGYAPIEPDGSFRVEVPADTPIGVTVVDAKGRALQTHTNWIQVRPGETRTCNGCHSPRRGVPINSSDVRATHGEPGETMAQTRGPAMKPERHMYSEDYWNPSATPADTIDIKYPAGFEPDIDDDGVITINYPDHIQPLWEKTLNYTGPSGESKCTDCHYTNSPIEGPDLTGGTGGFGRITSYQELVLGDPIIDLDTGLPIITIDEDGEVMMERETPLVTAGDSRQSSRTSHLIEVLFNEELRAEQRLEDHSSPLDHSGMLTPEELRLISEWIDLGIQYYNDPFDDQDGDGFKALSETRGGLQGLSEDSFNDNVHPVLMSRCSSCHQAFGNTGTLPDLSNPNPTFIGNNNFVLTGNPDGDFNVTVGMVSDVCDADNNPILLLPSSDNSGAPENPTHPLVKDSPTSPETPVLADDGSDADYNLIRDWINDDCGT